MDPDLKLMPSEIARLVLGYFEEEKNEEIYNFLLEKCPVLSESRLVRDQGQKIGTKLFGKSLTDILEEYRQIHSLAQKHVNDTKDTNINFHTVGGLAGYIKKNLDESSSRHPYVVSITLPTNSGGSHHSRSRQKSLRRKAAIHTELQNQQSQQLEPVDTSFVVPINNVETTPLASLPGNDQVVEFCKPSTSAHIEGTDEIDNTTKTSKTKACSSSSAKKSSLPASIPLPDVINFDDLELSILANCIIETPELPEKIAETINKARSPDETTETLQNKQPTIEKEEISDVNDELENIIQTTAQSAVEDPAFEPVLKKIIGMQCEETSDESDGRMSSWSVSSTPHRSQSVPRNLRRSRRMSFNKSLPDFKNRSILRNKLWERHIKSRTAELQTSFEQSTNKKTLEVQNAEAIQSIINATSLLISKNNQDVPETIGKTVNQNVDLKDPQAFSNTDKKGVQIISSERVVNSSSAVISTTNLNQQVNTVFSASTIPKSTSNNFVIDVPLESQLFAPASVKNDSNILQAPMNLLFPQPQNASGNLIVLTQNAKQASSQQPPYIFNQNQFLTTASTQQQFILFQTPATNSTASIQSSQITQSFPTVQTHLQSLSQINAQPQIICQVHIDDKSNKIQQNIPGEINVGSNEVSSLQTVVIEEKDNSAPSAATITKDKKTSKSNRESLSKKTKGKKQVVEVKERCLRRIAPIRIFDSNGTFPEMDSNVQDISFTVALSDSGQILEKNKELSDKNQSEKLDLQDLSLCKSSNILKESSAVEHNIDKNVTCENKELKTPTVSTNTYSSSRLSMSTPRSGCSHIRALDFSTPLKTPRTVKKVNTSPKSNAIAKFKNLAHSNKSENEKHRLKLFKTQSTCSKPIRTGGTLKTPQEKSRVSTQVKSIPIATRSPAPKLCEGWDNVQGVGLICIPEEDSSKNAHKNDEKYLKRKRRSFSESDLPPEELPKQSNNSEVESALKTEEKNDNEFTVPSWDADLRALASSDNLNVVRSPVKKKAKIGKNVGGKNAPSTSQQKQSQKTISSKQKTSAQKKVKKSTKTIEIQVKSPVSRRITRSFKSPQMIEKNAKENKVVPKKKVTTTKSKLKQQNIDENVDNHSIIEVKGAEEEEGDNKKSEDKCTEKEKLKENEYNAIINANSGPKYKRKCNIDTVASKEKIDCPLRKVVKKDKTATASTDDILQVKKTNKPLLKFPSEHFPNLVVTSSTPLPEISVKSSITASQIPTSSSNQNVLITPETTKFASNLPVNLHQNLNSLLETPMKDIFNSIPITPGCGTLMSDTETPITKLLREQTSIISASGIPTPSIPITPSIISLTPYLKDAGSPSSYNSRRTDYSACSGSYYIPSDNEQNMEALINECKKQEQIKNNTEKVSQVLRNDGHGDSDAVNYVLHEISFSDRPPTKILDKSKYESVTVVENEVIKETVPSIQTSFSGALKDVFKRSVNLSEEHEDDNKSRDKNVIKSNDTDSSDHEMISATLEKNDNVVISNCRSTSDLSFNKTNENLHKISEKQDSESNAELNANKKNQNDQENDNKDALSNDEKETDMSSSSSSSSSSSNDSSSCSSTSSSDCSWTANEKSEQTVIHLDKNDDATPVRYPLRNRLTPKNMKESTEKIEVDEIEVEKVEDEKVIEKIEGEKVIENVEVEKVDIVEMSNEVVINENIETVSMALEIDKSVEYINDGKLCQELEEKRKRLIAAFKEDEKGNISENCVKNKMKTLIPKKNTVKKQPPTTKINKLNIHRKNSQSIESIASRLLKKDEALPSTSKEVQSSINDFLTEEDEDLPSLRIEDDEEDEKVNEFCSAPQNDIHKPAVSIERPSVLEKPNNVDNSGECDADENAMALVTHLKERGILLVPNKTPNKTHAETLTVDSEEVRESANKLQKTIDGNSIENKKAIDVKSNFLKISDKNIATKNQKKKKTAVKDPKKSNKKKSSSDAEAVIENIECLSNKNKITVCSAGQPKSVSDVLEGNTLVSSVAEIGDYKQKSKTISRSSSVSMDIDIELTNKASKIIENKLKTCETNEKPQDFIYDKLKQIRVGALLPDIEESEQMNIDRSQELSAIRPEQTKEDENMKFVPIESRQVHCSKLEPLADDELKKSDNEEQNIFCFNETDLPVMNIIHDEESKVSMLILDKDIANYEMEVVVNINDTDEESTRIFSVTPFLDLLEIKEKIPKKQFRRKVPKIIIRRRPDIEQKNDCNQKKHSHKEEKKGNQKDSQNRKCTSKENKKQKPLEILYSELVDTTSDTVFSNIRDRNDESETEKDFKQCSSTRLSSKCPELETVFQKQNEGKHSKSKRRKLLEETKSRKSSDKGKNRSRELSSQLNFHNRVTTVDSYNSSSSKESKYGSKKNSDYNRHSTSYDKYDRNFSSSLKDKNYHREHDFRKTEKVQTVEESRGKEKVVELSRRDTRRRTKDTNLTNKYRIKSDTDRSQKHAKTVTEIKNNKSDKQKCLKQEKSNEAEKQQIVDKLFENMPKKDSSLEEGELESDDDKLMNYAIVGSAREEDPRDYSIGNCSPRVQELVDILKDPVSSLADDTTSTDKKHKQNANNNPNPQELLQKLDLDSFLSKVHGPDMHR